MSCALPPAPPAPSARIAVRVRLAPRDLSGATADASARSAPGGTAVTSPMRFTWRHSPGCILAWG